MEPPSFMERLSQPTAEGSSERLGDDSSSYTYADNDFDGSFQYGAGSTTTSNDNFKVVVRVRPPLLRELEGSTLRGYQCTTKVDDGRHITLSDNLAAALAQGNNEGPLYNTYRFTFDHVFDQNRSQDDVYYMAGQQVVLSTLQGYNAAIIAYGQTGTGKTYTMEGQREGILRGIIPRSIEDIFIAIANNDEDDSKFLVHASFLQIYNEVVSDLLKPESGSLTIREKPTGVYVERLSEWVLRSPSELYTLLEKGQAKRVTGSTKLNEVSSRSHAVCCISVEKTKIAPGAVSASQLGGPGWNSRPSTANGMAQPQRFWCGKLNLVDLAGSERVHVTGAQGVRLQESKKINASLSALGNVIAALTDKRERAHIPYRDSRLTRLLADSLGGNCKTTMIATIAPSLEAYQESLSTLKFANRAKNIKNHALVNENLDQGTLLRKYERELRALRAELAKRNKELVDKRQLFEAEEQKKRAEADKLAALMALEKRSREVMREKEERRALEAKIQAMQSALLMGGSTLEEAPAIKAMLKREQNKVREHYEARLRAIEAERQDAEGSRAEVDRYKQLLLKQRDIMIALTARLNERDDVIATLQEDLDATDRHIRVLEDKLDLRNAEAVMLQKDLYLLQKRAVQGGQGAGDDAETLRDALRASASGEDRASQPGAAAAAADPFEGPAGLGRLSLGQRQRSGQLNGRGGTLVYTADGSTLELQADSEAPTPPSGSVNAMHSPFGFHPSDRVNAEALEQQNANGAYGANSWSSYQQAQPTSAPLSAAGSGGGVAPADAALLQQQQLRIDELSSMCATATKEKIALKQILDSKVKLMINEIIAEVSGPQANGFAVLGGEGVAYSLGGGQRPSAALINRLVALDQLVSRVTGAM